MRTWPSYDSHRGCGGDVAGEVAVVFAAGFVS